MSVTFYGLLAYMLQLTISDAFVKYLVTVLLVLLIGIIGYSRVYLRVHYASDVIAGFLIGFLWLIISLSVLGGLEKYVGA